MKTQPSLPMRIAGRPCWPAIRSLTISLFAVQTTGIFCRPSCRARHALRKNVRFYPDARHAAQAGFRPCKRCMPDKRDPQAQKLAKWNTPAGFWSRILR